MPGDVASTQKMRVDSQNLGVEPGEQPGGVWLDNDVGRAMVACSNAERELASALHQQVEADKLFEGLRHICEQQQLMAAAMELVSARKRAWKQAQELDSVAHSIGQKLEICYKELQRAINDYFERPRKTNSGPASSHHEPPPPPPPPPPLPPSHIVEGTGPPKKKRRFRDRDDCRNCFLMLSITALTSSSPHCFIKGISCSAFSAYKLLRISSSRCKSRSACSSSWVEMTCKGAGSSLSRNLLFFFGGPVPSTIGAAVAAVAAVAVPVATVPA